MAFTTNPYCDVQQVIQAIDPNSTQLQTTDTAWIQELILEAQSAIDRELGYSFQTDGTTGSPAQRLYDGTGEAELSIDACISIVSVQELVYNVIIGSNGVYTSGTTQTTDITADTVLTPSSFIARNGYGLSLKRRTGLPFQEGLQNYVVNGVFGRPSVPPLIQRACVRLAIHYYKMRDSNYADQIIEQGRVRIIYSKPIPPDVMEIIEQFRVKRFYSR